MTADKYAEFVQQSDWTIDRRAVARNRILRYGLVGEIGSVVAAVKKRLLAEEGLERRLRPDDSIGEELGDLLLQVVFHAEIASAFDLEDVARGIADKLVSRHPHVFAPAGGAGVPDAVPADLHRTWEQRKAVEKGLTSALQWIPEQMSALARGHKVVARSRSRRVPLELPDEPVTADEVGATVLALVARAHASGIDPEQAVRDAVRGLER